MIATTAAHVALLNTRIFWAVDLYAFVFLDGSVFRLLGDTGAMSTTWQGDIYQSGGPIITRDQIRIARGLEADGLELTITPKAEDSLLGLPWREAVQNGAFDGCRVSLYRAHAPMPGASIVGGILRFSGPVEAWQVEQDIRLTIKSDLSKLDTPMPRAVYGPGCDRTLFDAGCGVARVAYQTNATVSNNSTRTVIKTGLAAASGYYSGGEIRFTSGQNAGARRTIKRHAGDSSLILTYPLNRAVTAGDGFVIWPGCSHDMSADGCAKFNNLARFRGEPFVPAPEAAF